MADTLEIFGTEYTNVTGIIATDDNGNELTYTRGGGSPTLETVTKTYTPSTSAVTDTITPGAGYDGIEEVDITVSAMPSMTLPTAASGTSSGTRKATIASSTSTQYINIPTGYNSANAYYQLSPPSAMTLPTTTSSTATGTLKATVTPGTANKYINIPTGYNSSNAYYTVSGDANLVAGNIKSGTSIFGVTGSYTGGGGGDSKNVQIVQNSSTRITATSYTKACGTITVAKAGTYDIYWCAYRTSSSGTWGTQWYKNGTEQGTAQTSFTNSYYQAIHLTNITLAKNDTIDVYGRSRGSNYYLYVGSLVIIEQ